MSAPFLIALGLTLAALAVVIATGVRARRNAHYLAVVVHFAFLGWAIYEAETMGKVLAYEGLSGTLRSMHFVAVTALTLFTPVLVFSGVRLARASAPAPRSRHRSMAMIFVILLVITAALGTAMTLTATRRQPTEDQPAGTDAAPQTNAPSDP